MIPRYSQAKIKGNDCLREVLKEDALLLRRYGLKLTNIEGGVSAAIISQMDGQSIPPWALITMDDKTWAWLLPLLQRLRDLEDLNTSVKADNRQPITLTQLAAK